LTSDIHITEVHDCRVLVVMAKTIEI